MTKFKKGDELKIVSKSIGSTLHRGSWPDMIGYIKEVRYNGRKLHGYEDDLYYAVIKNTNGHAVIKNTNGHGAYHFLEKDLRFLHEEDIMKELEFGEFEI